MTKAEQEYVTEINRLQQAIEKSESIYLKRDYGKKIRKMTAELREYRQFMYGGN